MTLTIPLTPEEEGRLLEKATAQDLTPEQMIRGAIEDIVAPRPALERTPQERVEAFRRWVRSFPPGLPHLTLEDVSREKLYERE